MLCKTIDMCSDTKIILLLNQNSYIQLSQSGVNNVMQKECKIGHIIVVWSEHHQSGGMLLASKTYVLYSSFNKVFLRIRL